MQFCAPVPYCLMAFSVILDVFFSCISFCDIHVVSFILCFHIFTVIAPLYKCEEKSACGHVGFGIHMYNFQGLMANES